MSQKLINIDIYWHVLTKTLGNRINIDVFEHWSTLISPFSMAISTHFLKTSSESTDLRPGRWRHEEGSVLEPCIRRCPEVDVRRMKPRGQWRPATVSSWKGNPPSHGGIGTPLLIALRHIWRTSWHPSKLEIDMGLCQNLDTIPASVDETVNNFYTSLGPALPIATLQWKIIIYKTSIIMAVNCWEPIPISSIFIGFPRSSRSIAASFSFLSNS